MTAEENLKNAITFEWIDSIRRQHLPIAESIATFLGFCTSSSIVCTKTEFSEQIEMKKLIARFSRENNLDEMQTRWAYKIAHDKIQEIAIEHGILTRA